MADVDSGTDRRCVLFLAWCWFSLGEECYSIAWHVPLAPQLLFVPCTIFLCAAGAA